MGMSRELSLPPAAVAGPGEPAAEVAWLASFHRGDRATLSACYRDHFTTASRAIGALLTGADRETVIHEVFSRLIAHADLRRSFGGGSFGAWLATVARNQAIDYRRRLGRELSMADAVERAEPAASWQESADARLLVERFRRERLPVDWAGVFELRFLQQLPQRDAARLLSMRRTTLAYRELRIRHLLKRFLLGRDEP